MSKFILFLLPFSVFGQDSFRVEYERRNFIKFEGNSEQYRMMEEQFSKPVYIELLGNQNECSLKEFEKVSNSQGPKVTMQVLGMEKDLETYLDFTNDINLVSREIENKLFLISSSIPKNDWKISRETKKINGYNAKKGTLEKEGFAYEVWFSTDIKSKCGPNEANGLPGLVLELKRTNIEKPDNYTTFLLNNLNLDNKVEFKKPSKGKSVTEDEYKDFRAEYDKKLREFRNNGIERDR